MSKRKFVPRPDGITHGQNYNVPYEYAPEMEISQDNFDIELFVENECFGHHCFNGCAAFQKVLDGKLI